MRRDLRHRTPPPISSVQSPVTATLQEMDASSFPVSVGRGYHLRHLPLHYSPLTSESQTNEAGDHTASERVIETSPASTEAHEIGGSLHASGSSSVQRHLASPTGQVQMGPEGGPLGAELSTRIAERRGSGAPLAEPYRQQMERHFGLGFAHVRLHADSAAQTLSSQLGARAFTAGNDIFLGAGARTDDSALLAHELTHVVQQAQISETRPLEVGPANSPAEHEAEVMSEAAVSHSSPRERSPRQYPALGRVVQRQTIPASFAPAPASSVSNSIPLQTETNAPVSSDSPASSTAASPVLSEGVGSPAENRYQADLDEARLAGADEQGAWNKVALDLLAFETVALRKQLARLQEGEADELYEACQRAIADRPQCWLVLERSYQEFLATQAWNMAVRRLNDFPRAMLPAHVSPAWVQNAGNLEALRQAAYGERFVHVRVAIMERQWHEATCASPPDGEQMLLILKGYNPTDIRAHLATLSPRQKDAFTEAASRWGAKDQGVRALLELLVTLDPRGQVWPVAPDAWQGIDAYPKAVWMEALPDAVQPPMGADQGRQVDIYRLIPQLRGGDPSLVYYLAYNTVQKRTEFAIGPASLDDFLSHLTLHKEFGEAYFGSNGLLVRGQFRDAVRTWLAREKQDLHTVGGWLQLLQFALTIVDLGRGAVGRSHPAFLDMPAANDNLTPLGPGPEGGEQVLPLPAEEVQEEEAVPLLRAAGMDFDPAEVPTRADDTRPIGAARRNEPPKKGEGDGPKKSEGEKPEKSGDDREPKDSQPPQKATPPRPDDSPSEEDQHKPESIKDILSYQPDTEISDPVLSQHMREAPGEYKTEELFQQIKLEIKHIMNQHPHNSRLKVLTQALNEMDVLLKENPLEHEKFKVWGRQIKALLEKWLPDVQHEELNDLINKTSDRVREEADKVLGNAYQRYQERQKKENERREGNKLIKDILSSQPDTEMPEDGDLSPEDQQDIDKLFQQVQEQENERREGNKLIKDIFSSQPDTEIPDPMVSQQMRESPWDYEIEELFQQIKLEIKHIMKRLPQDSHLDEMAQALDRMDGFLKKYPRNPEEFETLGNRLKDLLGNSLPNSQEVGELNDQMNQISHRLYDDLEEDSFERPEQNPSNDLDDLEGDSFERPEQNPPAENASSLQATDEGFEELVVRWNLGSKKGDIFKRLSSKERRTVIEQIKRGEGPKWLGQKSARDLRLKLSEFSNPSIPEEELENFEEYLSQKSLIPEDEQELREAFTKMTAEERKFLRNLPSDAKVEMFLQMDHWQRHVYWQLSETALLSREWKFALSIFERLSPQERTIAIEQLLRGASPDWMSPGVARQLQDDLYTGPILF